MKISALYIPTSGFKLSVTKGSVKLHHDLISILLEYCNHVPFNTCSLLPQQICQFMSDMILLVVEQLTVKLEDGKDEIKTLKRKHTNNIKVW